MLGADGVRHYFIAFTTPAESRGLGGFMGNWALLTADHGRLELTRSGRSADIDSAKGDPPRTLVAPPDYVARYGPLHPEQQLRDVTLSPDFPSVAQAIESTYPQTRGGEQIDGVIEMDPYALAAMLRITGPVRVKGIDQPLSADNAADYLLRQQYLAFDATADRVDALDSAAHQTFDAFIRNKNIRPTQLVNVFGPLVQQRRILASSTDPAVDALLRRFGMDGAFPSAAGGDLFGLATDNAGNNKMDVYLDRSIDYEATVDPATGSVDATATVTLHNDAPSSGLPDYVIGVRPDAHQPRGTNWMWFNFYSPEDLVGATMDGKPFQIGSQQEFGVHVYQTFLAVPSKGTTTIVLHLHGTVSSASPYRVSWYQQPTVQPDRVHVGVHVSAPWSVGETPGQTSTGADVTPNGDGTLQVDVRQSGRGS
jgi:hypothetical protein